MNHDTGLVPGSDPLSPSTIKFSPRYDSEPGSPFAKRKLTDKKSSPAESRTTRKNREKKDKTPDVRKSPAKDYKAVIKMHKLKTASRKRGGGKKRTQEKWPFKRRLLNVYNASTIETLHARIMEQKSKKNKLSIWTMPPNIDSIIKIKMALASAF